jgi:hypothetical protein
VGLDRRGQQPKPPSGNRPSTAFLTSTRKKKVVGPPNVRVSVPGLHQRITHVPLTCANGSLLCIAFLIQGLEDRAVPQEWLQEYGGLARAFFVPKGFQNSTRYSAMMAWFVDIMRSEIPDFGEKVGQSAHRQWSRWLSAQRFCKRPMRRQDTCKEGTVHLLKTTVEWTGMVQEPSAEPACGARKRPHPEAVAQRRAYCCDTPVPACCLGFSFRFLIKPRGIQLHFGQRTRKDRLAYHKCFGSAVDQLS